MPARWLRLWLTLRDPVGPREYLWSGLGLMALKYALDTGAVWLVLHRLWTPFNYFIPRLVWREATLRIAPDWLLWGFVLWSLPFMWIGVSMTLRRAVDAGRWPWLCLLFFLPGANYVVMLWLAFEPTRAREAWNAHEPEASQQGWLRSAALAIVTGCIASAALLFFCLFVIRPYGAGLFLGVPVLLGAITAFRFNRDGWREVGQTTHVVLAAVFVVGGALVLFAIEGVLCVAMAVPIAVPLAALGGLLGRTIALRTPSPAAHAWLLLLALPALAGLQAAPEPPALREVVSVIEIDAPPERVWEHVVAFSDLTELPRWFFRLGIAYPQRARIEGRGVGAVRRCEFSTGAFVEPITAWEAPRRLAFDVSAQPPPLAEWSPYRRVWAPAHDAYFRSHRGEFRLVALPGGRTRLEGRTWYTLDMQPGLYWRLWGDALIRRIHQRVLAHVKALAEAQSRIALLPVAGGVPADNADAVTDAGPLERNLERGAAEAANIAWHQSAGGRDDLTLGVESLDLDANVGGAVRAGVLDVARDQRRALLGLGGFPRHLKAAVAERGGDIRSLWLHGRGAGAERQREQDGSEAPTARRHNYSRKGC